MQEIVLPRLVIQTGLDARRETRRDANDTAAIVHSEQICTISEELVHYAVGTKPEMMNDLESMMV